MGRPINPNSRRSLKKAQKAGLSATETPTERKPVRSNPRKGIKTGPNPKAAPINRHPTRGSKTNWDAVESRFVNGKCGKDGKNPGGIIYPLPEEIVEEFGISLSNFELRCTRGGWVAKRAAVKAEIKRLSDEALLAEIAGDLTLFRVHQFRLAQLGQVKAKQALETGNPKNAVMLAGAMNSVMKGLVSAQDLATGALGIEDLPAAGGLNLNLSIGDWTLFSAKNRSVVIDEEIPPTIGEVTRQPR